MGYLVHAHIEQMGFMWYSGTSFFRNSLFVYFLLFLDMIYHPLHFPRLSKIIVVYTLENRDRQIHKDY